MTDVRIVLVTAPDDRATGELARALVEERLVACVNLVPAVRSIYRWKGRVCDDREVLLVMKTVEGSVRALVERVMELHPYEVPEVLAVPVASGAEAYLRWVQGETRRQ